VKVSKVITTKLWNRLILELMARGAMLLPMHLVLGFQLKLYRRSFYDIQIFRQLRCTWVRSVIVKPQDGLRICMLRSPGENRKWMILPTHSNIE